MPDPMTSAARHAPDYRPLAGNDDLTCAVCYGSWPCETEQRRQVNAARGRTVVPYRPWMDDDR